MADSDQVHGPFKEKANKREFTQIIKTIEKWRVSSLVEHDHLSEAQSHLGDKAIYLDIPGHDAQA